jgi:hypothetical protein
LVKRTRATLRKAEFGFFGVVVLTTVHTPRFCGDGYLEGRRLSVFSPTARAGTLDFDFFDFLPCLTNWLNVGINTPPFVFSQKAARVADHRKSIIAGFQAFVQRFIVLSVLSLCFVQNIEHNLQPTTIRTHHLVCPRTRATIETQCRLYLLSFGLPTDGSSLFGFSTNISDELRFTEDGSDFKCYTGSF